MFEERTYLVTKLFIQMFNCSQFVFFLGGGGYSPAALTDETSLLLGVRVLSNRDKRVTVSVDMFI